MGIKILLFAYPSAIASNFIYNFILLLYFSSADYFAL